MGQLLDMTTKIKNIDKKSATLRLYGIDNVYFTSIDELFSYRRQNASLSHDISVIDYYQDFFGEKDIIRRTDFNGVYYYKVIDYNTFAIFSDDSENISDWQYVNGDIKYLYEAIKKQGIIIENDVYAEKESQKAITKYYQYFINSAQNNM